MELEPAYNIHSEVFRLLHRAKPYRKVLEAWFKCLDQLQPLAKINYVTLEPEEADLLLRAGLIKHTKRFDKYIVPKNLCFLSLEPTIETLLSFQTS